MAATTDDNLFSLEFKPFYTGFFMDSSSYDTMRETYIIPLARYNTVSLVVLMLPLRYPFT